MRALVERLDLGRRIRPLAAPIVPILFNLFFIFFLILPAAQEMVAQGVFDEVHVLPREKPAGTALASAAIPAVPGASGYAIRKDVDLVLVPVTVTDPRERLVTGLTRDNFQIFDGKKAQEIRHFLERGCAGVDWNHCRLQRQHEGQS